MQNKSLLVILYGEPRGLGNSPDCPGSNQFDIIFDNKDIYSVFDKKKVLWYISDTTIAPTRPWDNTFMIDKNDNSWSCKEYLPMPDIIRNIHAYMKNYKGIDYEIKVRQDHSHRWGKDYLDCIDYALNGDYDCTLFHRPDSNITEEYVKEPEDKERLRLCFKDFLIKKTDTPVVCLPAFPNGNMTELVETDTEYKKAYCSFWNTFEMMAWNRAGLESLRTIIKLKCDNLTHSEKDEQNENYRGHHAHWMHVENENLSIAENFWPMVLNMLKIIYPKFTVLDVLPWRSFIRTKVKEISSHYEPPIVKPCDIIKKDMDPNTIVLNSREHGYDLLNREIKRLYEQRKIVTFWAPRVLVRKLYNNFCNYTHEDYSKIELRDILNLQDDYDLYNVFEADKVMDFKVTYNPDSSHHIPRNRYYENVYIESLDGVELRDPAKILMHYALYIWYNDFNFKNNLWDRNLSLYIDENKNWKLHPGRARTGYSQFSDTDTPMFFFVHESLLPFKLFKDDKLIRVDNNLEEIMKVVQQKNGMENPEMFLRISDTLCDAWYSDQDPDANKSINTGEKYNFYFGDTLRVGIRNGSIFYNGEKVSFVDPDSRSLVFTEPWLGPKYKIADKEFNMEKFEWPWEYYIVDDFFPEEMLKGINGLPIESDNTECNGTRTNVTGRWFLTPDKSHQGLAQWVVKFFRDNKTKFEEQFGYDLSNSYMRIEVCKDDNGFFQERHLDTLEKRITMIVYIHRDDEEVDLGTDIFVDETSGQYKRAEWKRNRCLVFKPTDKTWHGFSAREFKGQRRVLICNFVDKDQWESKDQVWDT